MTYDFLTEHDAYLLSDEHAADPFDRAEELRRHARDMAAAYGVPHELRTRDGACLYRAEPAGIYTQDGEPSST